MPADAPRRSYRRGRLEMPDLDPDPLRQLERWLADALGAGMLEPNAMTLATADARGRVSARMVLLKGIVDGGLAFFTHFGSRKAQEIDVNPRAAATFWWDRLERQVRLEGTVERVTEEASRRYFAERPYGSQLAAWASQQSRPLADREELEERVSQARERFGRGPVPLPPHWGGFLLRPDVVEFWQGREDRLHDRFLYTPGADGWAIARLYP